MIRNCIDREKKEDALLGEAVFVYLCIYNGYFKCIFLGRPELNNNSIFFFKIGHVFWDETTLLSKELSPNDLFIFQVREYICDIAMASHN